MPKLTEIERLATSDSHGGRVIGTQQRKYQLTSDRSPGRTRGQSKAMMAASAALLQIGNLNTGSQPASGTSSLATCHLPQTGDLNTGNQSGVRTPCEPEIQDEKKFVKLPDEWTLNVDECSEKSKVEGKRTLLTIISNS